MKKTFKTIFLIAASFLFLLPYGVKAEEQVSQKYYIGKIAVLNAMKNEITIVDFNTNQEKTFVAEQGVPTNLSLGQEVVITTDDRSNKIQSLRPMGQQAAEPSRQKSCRYRPAAPEKTFDAPMFPYSSQEDPFEQRMRSLQRRMNQMFDDDFYAPSFDWTVLSPLNQVTSFNVTSDWQETDKAYILEMNIPGMKKKDIHVEIKNGMLIVSGEKKSSSKEEKPQEYSKQEQSYGQFYQAFSIPQDAKEKKFDVKYEKDILTVTIPKKNKK